VPVEKYLQKIEKSRNVEPPKSFVVKVGEEHSAEEAKHKLWSGLRKNKDMIQIKGTWVMPKGDLKITPVEGNTLNAMQALYKKSKDIKELNLK